MTESSREDDGWKYVEIQQAGYRISVINYEIQQLQVEKNLLLKVADDLKATIPEFKEQTEHLSPM